MDFNANIVSPEVQYFILQHENTDPNQIALKKSPFPEVSSLELAQQIESRRKAKKKLPTWFQTERIYYPKALSIEQSSSELTANFKRQLINANESVIDLTGGFGVDTYYLSLTAGQITHCEIDSQLSRIAEHNAEMLNRGNIRFKQGNGIDILRRADEHFDTIYLDPSRRVNTKKVFLLQDCEPDILEHQQTLMERARRIIVKSSPLLDISQTLTQLKHIRDIHILSMKNECKELLVVLNREDTDRPKITATLLNDHEGQFSFYADEERDAQVSFGKPENYLYDPDAALLKAGCFKLVSSRYQLNKLHVNTHLYTSEGKKENFAGRVFKVTKLMNYKEFKKEKNHPAASVISKNFPMNAASLRKKHKISESAHQFLFFCKTVDEKLQVIFADRIS